ncbi:MAG: tetratricopeptide repeat protein [Candidatus Marinimicrobia bacterium]|nr:tetratricopeptide repeat protein [Candidatus Neomarinimicrobiota bacterium]MCF7903575.1 tetratricopeptide repeat protein [Candidatus Neomarinimicrobiota bacterium]
MGLQRWLILAIIATVFVFSCSEDPDVLFSKAETEASLGSKQKALNYLMEIQRSSPEYTDAYLFAAELFLDDQNLTEAVNMCRRGLDAKADSAKILRYIGEIYQLSGSNENAYRYYLMAVEANGEDAEARISLGLILNEKDLYEQAQAHFDKALEIDPGNYEAIVGKALTYYKSQENAKAIDLLQDLTKEEPMKGEAHGVLAMAQEKTAVEDKVIIDNYALAVKLEPRNQLVWNAYVDFMIRERESKEAIDVLKTYLKYFPDATEARHSLAELYIDLAQKESLSWLDAALQQCDQALLTNSDDHYGHALRAQIYLLQEKPRLAVLEAQLAFEINPVTQYRELVDQAKFFAE